MILNNIKTRSELLNGSRSALEDEDKCPRFPLGTIVEHDGIMQQVIEHNSSGYPTFSISGSQALKTWEEINAVKVLWLPVIDESENERIRRFL